MAEQRVNAAGQTVEFNEDSQRWEPVKEDVKSDESVVTSSDVAGGDDSTEDEGKPSTFNYTPKADK